jgi:oryzin
MFSPALIGRLMISCPRVDKTLPSSTSHSVLAVNAAGNENSPAENSSPCRSPEVICVGNAEIDFSRHSGGGGSNYGPEVDIFAVGTNIVSASWRSDTAEWSTTGTSMASPAVAGLVSYLRALEGPSTAAEVKARVYELATPGVVTDTLGSVNLMASTATLVHASLAAQAMLRMPLSRHVKLGSYGR